MVQKHVTLKAFYQQYTVDYLIIFIFSNFYIFSALKGLDVLFAVCLFNMSFDWLYHSSFDSE